MIRIAKGTELSLQQNTFVFLQRLMQIEGCIAYHRPDPPAKCVISIRELIRIKGRFVIERFQQRVFLRDRAQNPAVKKILIKKVIDLDADFQVFIAVERRDPGFGGTERSFSETFFLQTVKKDMILHQHLRTI